MNGTSSSSSKTKVSRNHIPSSAELFSDNETRYPKGRVENLTADQEYVLKEVWGYLLKFWGYDVVLPQKYKSSDNGSPVIHRTNTVNSIKSNSTARTSSTSSGSSKKKFMSRFGGNKKKNGHHNVDELTRQVSQLSTEPGVSVNTDMAIHNSFKNMKGEQVKQDFWKFLRHDTPDNLVLRFVRARKWNADKSLMMLANTLHWRVHETKVDKIFEGNELAFIDKDGVMLQFDKGKAYIRGYDLKGKPIVIVRPRFHHSSDQNEEDMQTFILLVIEYARLFLNEPVDSASIIFDLTDFSMANMDYAPVKFMVKCFEAHYPESLGTLLIHKAPWVFGGIWSIIKNWLDPVVASKINFTKNLKDLQKFVDIKHIPKELGGNDTFNYKYIKPSEKDKRLASDACKTELLQEREELIAKFIESTILWVESTEKSDNDRYRKEKILIGRQLSNNYIALWPYLVNKTIYHRFGYLELQEFEIFYDSID
ncbi:hypothetical protein PACTADRAFT_49547 [Pachysolen tannophilus NRRL Y-2460]|uniref:CRAL-TRIO domain-containing protein n=1 Tax=Pachysolen tannophilus NRRL Y-2460 TaxID=669874 RepID=A0A1E4TWN7_PACTA|nr:hypothetical protein PACTADRAFT_49547 [Pachysolen tannophilus NRRL Y-2460]